ncbi:hypothetical protein R7D97_16315 [Vibrio sp. Vb5031]|uniref:Uncharacterized protein n=1 Tax=Vibrio hepatarius TaxID=171383 RepID=A0A0M0HYR2_9VIBR|nr:MULTISPECIES: hypothetical protein [Vibrio]KOO06967.1 hypothetical protein AKJ31_14835 [Vibrio hepatarius]MCA2421874.1 hypothetical protein [Vibrio alginolyticus]MCA2446518.1 hypothetical protein [Vibrio alginolyticus]MCR9821564.1 hypothetical protein [Vibrio parahaemolyticus]MDF5094092.1 hypothetical protein [Vibrio parahaemolyticus]
MKYQLKSGLSIFLVTVIFEDTVHVNCGQGFTDTVHRYAIADSKSVAEKLATEHFERQGLAVRISDGFESTRTTVNSLIRKDVLGFDAGVTESA